MAVAKTATSPRRDGPNASAGVEPSSSLLVEFAGLWNRGLTEPQRLWQLFDVCEMYLQRPGYFGAPVFNTGKQVVSPVFSTQERLARFVWETGQLDENNSESGYDWACLSGAQVFGLPVRARYLCIDPESEHAALVDLGMRENPPALANGAPPVAINLELHTDGAILGGPASRDQSNTES